MLAVFLQNGAVSTASVACPQRPEKHALLRLICAGICNTDLELQRGYYGFSGIPGHEFVAEVVETPDRRLLHRRVVGEINLPCRVCEWCRRGLARHCPNRSVLGIVRQPGAFQEYFTLPEANLHVVPGAVPDEAAVFTEPLAAACEILDQVDVPLGATVAVLGDGKLGLLVAQVLRAHRYGVHVFGRHEEKLRIAALMGAETSLAGHTIPQAEFDWVVEATGSAEGLRAAVAMTRPRGTVVVKSTVHGEIGIDMAPVIVNEITLVGSRCGRFEAAVPLLEPGVLRLEEMIHARYPLAEAPEAFAHAARKGTLKVLLVA